jgi:valyl-tRNA synthetase
MGTPTSIWKVFRNVVIWRSCMELPSVYSPEETESKWYPLWEERGLFGSRPDPQRPAFTIVIPPPNVTGSFHMGHALEQHPSRCVGALAIE